MLRSVPLFPIGSGAAEECAELLHWHVGPGDRADVMDAIRPDNPWLPNHTLRDYLPARCPLSAVLPDAMGRQVQQEVMSGPTGNLFDRRSCSEGGQTSNLSTGLYHLHLTDGTSWLAGGKVVIAPQPCQGGVVE